ncbi:hypothetical protein Gotri_004332, partial [Gossypium trilobum]|nr:hypothetical protein [Gossypium trilobum]
IRYTKASDLINKEENTWKQEIIRTLFGEEQLRHIVSIPLVSSRIQDVPVWCSDNTGLWEIKIPSKICILIWRIANDYLPTLHYLKARYLDVNTVCPVCQTEEESVDHLFSGCFFTQQVLRGLGVVVTTCNRETIWKNWLAKEFENLSIEECEIRAITYWAIWYNRNKIYHDGVRESVAEVVGFIKAYYTDTAVMRERLKNSWDGENLVWEPPDNDTIKINFDASFNHITNCSISGILARNKEGLIMAACSYPWKNIPDPVMAEAKACLQAVTLAEDMGFLDVCIEGDALTIIRKLRLADEDRSCISSLIKEIKERGCRFRRLSFKHMPRAANKAAHAMAKDEGRYEHPRI